MRRRTLISASIGLGTLAGLAWLGRAADTPAAAALAGLQPFEASERALGTTVTLKLLHGDAAAARAALDSAFAQIHRVEALMSLFRDDSQLATLNRQGRLDAPDAQLLQVLAQAQQLSQMSGGDFDVTVQPLWLAFTRAQDRGGLPTAAELAAARSRVGWQKLHLSPQRVQFAEAGMGVTLNGLAQGYATDVALAALRGHGISHALLDTGEFAAVGDKADGQPWTLGIKHPRQPDTLVARVRMDGRALATSGDYETTFSPDFLHHHIFDPASGDSPTVLASATVLAPSGIQADGLSTAFMVMGAERSLRLTAQLAGVDAMLIAKDGSRWQTPGFAALAA